MEISNAKKFGRLKKNNVLLNIFFVGAIITLFMIEELREIKTYIIMGIAIVYILLLIYFIMLKYTYLFFKFDGTKIIVKHYTLSPIARKYVSFEIPKNQFLGFEIKKAFFNKRDDLYLHTRFNNKKASYPAISLTALDKMDKSKLVEYLQKINA